MQNQLPSGLRPLSPRPPNQIARYEQQRISGRCVACQVAFRGPVPPQVCPRCGANNRAWQDWLKAGQREHVRRFFLGSAWGWLALLSLLLPAWAWFLFDVQPLYGHALLVTAALGLGIAGLVLIYQRREALWLRELVRQSSRASQTEAGSRLGILAVGGIGFGVFSPVGVMLAARLLKVGQGGAGGLISLHWGFMLVICLAIAGLTISAGLYALYAYGQWRAKTFPRPIFLDRLALMKMVETEARWRIMLKLRKQRHLMMQVLAAIGSKQGGVTLEVRAEMSTDKTTRGHFLRAVQYWQAVANRWGKIRNLEQDGPEEYILDLERPYDLADPPPSILPLEGELIEPDKPSISIKDAIINAVVSTALKRR